jgi:chloramphenicol-sensitive protein RarD
MNRGFWYGVLAYGLWGLFPIYFKQIGHVPAMEVLGHRIVWSFLILAALVFGARGRRMRRGDLPRHVLALVGAAALFIGVNWLVYVWAVTSGFIVETSLGYFVTPLVNVLLGVILLRERLRPGQWVAVGVACAGVLYLTATYGSLPWISLTLAVSFGSYGLIKKKVALGSLHGLTVETGILFLPALTYVALLHAGDRAVFLQTGAITDVLLGAAGLITIGPLLLFATAVQRIPLSTIGLLQYIAPTIQFLLGVLVYDEPFTGNQLIGFTIVWAALVIFTVEGFLVQRTLSRTVEDENAA